MQSLLIGFFFAALIGYLAWRAGSLAPSGGLAAFVVGGLIFGIGGFPWAALMLTFFISSSLLSKLFAQRKAKMAEKFAKGSQRDWGQVLANSAAGAGLVILQAMYPDQLWPWLAYAGAMASVNGDTWATELGVLSASAPRLITTGKKVPVGTSGGISQFGSLATLGGAFVVALVMILTKNTGNFWSGLWIVSLAGLAGATVDSFLGATVQAIYYDPVKEKETERRIYDESGSLVKPLRGWPWMNNDLVNFICSVFGALTAAGLWIWIH